MALGAEGAPVKWALPFALRISQGREVGRRVMKDYQEMPFMFERSGSKVIFDDRRYSAK